MTPCRLNEYKEKFSASLASLDLKCVEELALGILAAHQKKQAVWICGNGGSAANSAHWANDFLYPITRGKGVGLSIHCLSSNSAVLTCLANDVGFDQIFSRQLQTLAREDDLLIVLSGSGNSPNILEALRTARVMRMKSYAILGFDGGKAKAMADTVIQCPGDDMQIAEDLQMVICHMLIKRLQFALAAHP